MKRIPVPAYFMALGTFVMVSSELIVSGLMPQMARDLGVTIPHIGYLVTVYALAMALGGPVLTLSTKRLRTNHALLVLFVVFFIGNAIAAVSESYGAMVVGRLVTGAASGAFFGMSLAAVAQVTTPELRGRATGVVMQGLMLGTALGLPLSALIGGSFGWRAAFYAIAALMVIVAVATMLALPRLESDGSGGLGDELRAFRNPPLWGIMATSTLIIGATFAAFSYFAPILIEVTGFSEAIVPLLLLGYGAATVVGNVIVGRLAQSHTISVIVVGLLLNAVFLVGFGLFAQMPVVAVVAMAGVGLVGITLNPAMITRVQRTGGTGALVQTAHSSFITFGVVIGAWIGGLGIDASGLRAPLWVGAGLAVLALLAMVPAILTAHRSPRAARKALRSPASLTADPCRG